MCWGNKLADKSLAANQLCTQSSPSRLSPLNAETTQQSCAFQTAVASATLSGSPSFFTSQGNAMLSENSSLKKLSARVDRKQAMYIDGIRHAAEISCLAYSRLRQTLSVIATTELNEKEMELHTTAAFLDAWALVDAIDRFRALWKQIPIAGKKANEPGEPTLDEVLQPIRNLRNVADHIAQRIDLVVAKRSAALGVISWFTATNTSPVQGFLCAIIPGTLKDHRAEIPTPSGRSFEWPTGAIRLEAGGYSAYLCDALPHLARRVADLEAGISEVNAALPPGEEYAGCDILIKAAVRFEGGGINDGPDSTGAL